MRVVGYWAAPVLMALLGAVCFALGGQRVVHMGRAAYALAHDPACRRTIDVTTPAGASAACRIVSGRIVRAYETQTGTQYNGGTAYDQYVVFAPPDGGPTAEFRSKRSYSHQTQPEPGPAVAEYVDGQIYYLTSGSARIGPVFDPATDGDLGRFLIGLGAFFVLVAAATGFFALAAAKRRGGPTRLRSGNSGHG